MTALVNTHTHTLLSGHGTGSVGEVVKAAQAAGICTLALTEHYPLSKAYDPHARLSMPQEHLEGYLADISRSQAAYPDMEVLSGCELDWLREGEDRTFPADAFKRFDVVLGSVHFVDGWAFDDPATRSRWDEEGPDSIWERYIDTWCEATLSSSPFTIMAHPDLAKKFGYYPSFDLAPRYRMMAQAAQEAGRMVEVNTSGLFYACAEMYPAPALLREFCRAGVPCSVGTDAHQPSHVGRAIEAAYRLMYECGYREITFPTRKGDRRTLALD
ncbi:MAG: histidinol-phosphatase HisJ family protein [Coriobacteriaceae bacterium]|jgi:histidinol-phosphatase (PHP family)|nr:histidinol-phosphatase HisJ family protein [Coriobacteriaceae bacterium]